MEKGTLADERLKSDLAPGIVSGVAGIGTLVAILLFRDQVPVARGLSRIVGFSGLYAGMALFLWGAAHLRGGIAGLVAPRLAGLVTAGPFRFVRHPTYLAMSVAMVGASIATRSVVGLAVVALVFLPAEIHRARLEERALRQRFGERWQEYASEVGFFVPGVGKVPRHM